MKQSLEEEIIDGMAYRIFTTGFMGRDDIVIFLKGIFVLNRKLKNV